MKLLNILLMGICALNFACSLQSDDQNGLSTGDETQRIEHVVLVPGGDVDGDMVKNQKEKELGRNPYVAELPELDIKFLQNFKITMSVVKKADQTPQEVLIDTMIGRDDPSFKYRTGKIFARHNTYKTVANVGRFDGHTWGEIGEHDLSWVKYPEIDPVFYHNELIKNKKFFNNDDYQIKNIKIELENTINLKANRGFKEVSNLELSFYYFDYEKDNYELLGNFIADRHFKAGVRETVSITLDNIPVSLIKDNFLTKGEFIISEATDFEINEMKTNYKTLLKSIKAKSVPIVFNTPNETSVKFVGVDGKKDSFISILDRIYPDKVKIQDDKLVKIEQFQNNLGSYTYLKDIRDKDKKGKWFIFTNKLTKHYLDHGFMPNDRIYLSYITGMELARQKDEIIYSYRKFISGNDDYELYPLGNILPNSRIDIQIRPERGHGENISSIQEIFDRPGGSCGRNCVTSPIYCKWDINLVTSYDKKLSFSRSLKNDAGQIEFVVNDEVFDLDTLVSKGKMKIRWIGENLHLVVEDISKIKELLNFEENLVHLKIKTNKRHDFWGVKLVEVGGIWGGVGGCPFTTPQIAFTFGSKYISNETLHLGEIHYVYNNVLNAEGRSKVSFKDSGMIYQKIDVSVSSTIENYFN